MTSSAQRLLAAAAFAMAAVLAVWTAPIVAAPPLQIDLDAFDASRKQVALPNGISLAYVDIGPRDAPVVLLIHGYTSNARGWVPLLCRTSIGRAVT